MGSCQFGYNINVSFPTEVTSYYWIRNRNIKKLYIFKTSFKFIEKDFFLFARYYEGLKQLSIGESWLNGNKSKYEEAFSIYELRKAKYFDCIMPFVGNETCAQIMKNESAIKLAQIQEKEMKKNNITVKNCQQRFSDYI